MSTITVAFHPLGVCLSARALELLGKQKIDEAESLIQNSIRKGLAENVSIDQLRRDVDELERLKNSLLEGFRKVASNHASRAGRNSSLRLVCIELFKDNQAMAMRLSGLLAANSRLANLLGMDESSDPRDSRMVNRYVLSLINKKQNQTAE